MLSVRLFQRFGDLIDNEGGILQREPDMFVVLMLFFAFFMFFALFMIVLVRLHAFLDFLFLCLIAEDIHQVEDGHILVVSLLEGIIHPFVGLAADIDEDIAVGDIDDVLGGGLVAVQVDAVVEQQVEVDVRVILRDLAHPVIDRKNGGDHLDVGFLRFGRAAADKQGCQYKCAEHQREQFFHMVFLVNIV